MGALPCAAHTQSGPSVMNMAPSMRGILLQFGEKEVSTLPPQANKRPITNVETASASPVERLLQSIAAVVVVVVVVVVLLLLLLLFLVPPS